MIKYKIIGGFLLMAKREKKPIHKVIMTESKRNII